MSEDLIREWLGGYQNDILTHVGMYGALFIGLLVLFRVGKAYLGPGNRRAPPKRVYNVPSLEEMPADAATGFVAARIPSAEKPGDGQFFRAILDFASNKRVVGQPLHPQEYFVLGQLAFLERMLVSEGPVYLDSLTSDPPYKSFELRQALEQIDAIAVVDLVERLIVVGQHRRQLIGEMVALGTDTDQAFAHPDVPSYAPLEAEIADKGAAAYFIQQADAYVETVYPWEDKGQS